MTLPGRTENGTDADLVEFQVGVAVSLTFWVGIIQLVMWILNLSFITVFLAKPMMQGFVIGAACLIMNSQIRFALFGVVNPMKKFSGPGVIILTVIEAFRNIKQVHWQSLVIFLGCLLILTVVKFALNENVALRQRAKRWFRYPIPIELIVTIIIILISYYASLETYGVSVIGIFESGLPPPMVPSRISDFSLISKAFPIALISFFLHFSLADMYASKNGYQIRSKQELCALGLMHTVSSFFGCFAGTSAPPRCALADACQAKSQINALITSLIVLITLYALGPAMAPFPFSAVAAIIVVALLGLLLQLKQVKIYWRMDGMDAAVFILTFLSVFLLDLILGLVVGVGLSLISTHVRGQIGLRVSSIGPISDVSDHLVVLSQYSSNRDDDNDIKLSDTIVEGEVKVSVGAIRNNLILQPTAPVIFTNAIQAKEAILTKLSKNPGTERVILDCTFVSYIDITAIDQLTKLSKALAFREIELSFINCSRQVRSVISESNADLFNHVYPTYRYALHDQ